MSPVSNETQSFTYSVLYLNRAPVVDQTLYNLSAIYEDISPEANTGTRVDDITSSVASDPDDLQLGIAVISANDANGFWEYRESGSDVWIPFPTPTAPYSALALPYSSWVRFTPNPEFFGASYFDALAWDMSDGGNISFPVNTTAADPFTGPFSTESVRVEIAVLAVNDPPLVELDVTAVEFTETGPRVQLFGGNLRISDIDNSELVLAVVTLECPACDDTIVVGDDILFEGSGSATDSLSLSAGDVILTVRAPPNFMATSSSEGESIRIEIRATTGGDSSPAAFVRYLESLYFLNNDVEPASADRVVQLYVSDGTNSSSVVTVTVSINLVNDEPPVVVLPYESITFVEDSPPLEIFGSNLSIIDLDDNDLFPLIWATVELLNANLEYESLSADCSATNLSCSFNDSLGILTVSGEESVAQYEQVLGAVFYENSAEEPDDLPRRVSVRVMDQMFISSPEVLTLEIQLINDQLPVVMLAESVIQFREENPVSPPARIAPGVVISDSDSGSFPLHSAVIELLDPLDPDLEGLRSPSGFPSPNNITLVIDDSDPNRITISVGAGDGLPVMTLQDFLRLIEYFNEASQPAGSSRTVQITVYDNLTRDGVQAVPPTNVTILFSFVDDPPFVELNSEVVRYSEGQDPAQVAVAPGAVIIDVDDDEISGLIIRLQASDPSIDVTQETLRVNVTGSGITLIDPVNNVMLELQGEAPIADYVTVLRSLTYEHTVVFGDPDAGRRTITVTPLFLNSSQGTADEVTIAFSAVDNPPVIDLNGPASGRNHMVTFVEERPLPLPLVTPDFVLIDVDSPELAYVEIILTPLLDAPYESISVNASLAPAVTVENLSAGFIRLLGPAPVEYFRNLLSSLAYFNAADEPDPTNRNVSIAASDGNSTSVAYSIVTIMLRNDPPAVFLDGDEASLTITYTENGSPAPIAENPLVVDPDSRIVSVRVRPESSLFGDNITGLSFDQIMRVYRENFSPPATVEEVQDFIASLAFISLVLEPPVGDRVYCVSVTDEQSAPSEEACVTVLFQSVNDNAPIFQQSIYIAEISENRANAPVVQVVATDADSVNSNASLFYAIVSGDDCSPEFLGSASGESDILEPLGPCRFTINSTTGVIFTSEIPPDREERDQYLLTVAVTDGLPENTRTTVVNVTIEDVNDNRPVFDPALYNATVPLGAQPGFVLADLVVVDPDEGEVNIGINTIDPQAGMGVFTLDPDLPGRVLLSVAENQLDPTVARYQVTFFAIENSQPFGESTNSATLIVNVILNDAAPVFDAPSYSADILESAEIGSFVLSVRASDTDQGSNGDIRYTLGSPAVPFAINSTTGDITVSTALDFETSESHIFTVVATDQGRLPRSSSVEVTIDIINVNEHMPVFSEDPYTRAVCEGVPLGFEILRVSATDEDAGFLGEVTYSILGGSILDCTDCISLNSSTGAVTTVQELDFEQFSSFSFFALATDPGLRIGEAQVVISVLNNNEFRPEFAFTSGLQVSISENYQVGNLLPVISLVQPLATDADTCDVDQCNGETIIDNSSCSGSSGLVYSIPVGNEQGFFAINPSTGVVSLVQELDFEAGNRQFALMISVTDGEFDTTAELLVSVTDFNEHLPMFTNLPFNVTILESIAVGDQVFQVEANDSDPTAQITFSLAGENADDFEIDLITGIIRVSQPLNFESVSSYTLMVVAMDTSSTGNMTSVADLGVFLMDVNDFVPRFEPDDTYTFEVEENQPPTTIGSVSAIDLDSGSGSQVEYSILVVTPGDPSLFTIDPLTGEIATATVFDREEFESYTLTVQAQDGGDPSLSSNATVTVRILDLNDNTPAFQQTQFSFQIPESAGNGTEVAVLVATDPDAGDNGRVTFAIASGNELGHFNINPASGLLYVSSELDRETVASYLLEVSATDFGVPPMSSIATVEISLTDVNDNPAIFAGDFSANIIENSAEGTFVIQVTALDPDSGTNADISFAFYTSPPDNPFVIDPTSGNISVGNSTLLDRESLPVVELTVMAFNPSDPQGENSSALVTITLLDVNDEVPQFTESVFTIAVPEDFTPVSGGIGSGLSSGGLQFITTVSATDSDDPSLPNSEFTFAIVSSSGPQSFIIDFISGDIFALVSLDREATDFYELTVQVTDAGLTPLSSTATVAISVLDINDNVPEFSEAVYRMDILENLPMGSSVVGVVAMDADEGSNSDIRFSILQDSIPFQIDSTSGLIQTTTTLDREAVPVWTFTVAVTDLGSPALSSLATVEVTVVDENDNGPVISPGSLNLTMPENTPIGTVLATFDVSDSDEGVNAQSNITLTGQSSSFSINDLGDLEVSGALDYEAVTEYQFSVNVRNIAPPHFTTSASVFIQLENVNDNAALVNFDRTRTPFIIEGQNSVALTVGATISDADGLDVTRITGGIVAFVDPNPREPSYPFTPTTEGLYVPYECPLEDKVSKISACRLSDSVILTSTSDLLADPIRTIRNLDTESDLSDNTVLFDASQQQYVIYTPGSDDTLTIGDAGLTIATWIWVTPSEPRTRLTILAKVSPFELRYGLFCDADSSLEFQYYTQGAHESVFFPDACSLLENSWHHLTAVIDNTDPSMWLIRVYIDGSLHGSQPIAQPDDTNGNVYVGARTLQATFNAEAFDFFSGRLHLLIISPSIATRNNIDCLTGCGVALISSLDSSLLSYSYDYDSRSLTVDGTQMADSYEQFLNSLILVLPFTEPSSSSYGLSYTLEDEIFNCIPTFIVIPLFPTNDFPPQLSLNGATDIDFSTTFVEERGPVSLLNQTSFSLTDGDLIEFPYTVMVEILDPLQPMATEQLTVQNVPQGMNVSYESFVLTLSGELPLPLFESVLRTITYNNTNDEPLGTSRQILFTVTDPPQPDAVAMTTLAIQFINDPPILQLTFSTAEYSEGDGEVQFLESTTITDSDNTTLLSAAVSFMPLDGELEILSTDTTGTAIQADYDASTGTLVLSGEDTLGNYTTVLRSIAYNHLEMSDPTQGTRVFSLSVFDGVDSSEPVVAMVFFAAVNDAPVLDLNGPAVAGFDFTATFTEDSSSTIPAISLDATLIDVDNVTLEFVNVTLLSTLDGDRETLLITTTDAGEVSNTFSGTSFFIRPEDGALIDDFLGLLLTIQYQNLAEEPTGGARRIEFVVGDGLDSSMPVFTNIIVNTENDRPVLDLDTEQIRSGFQASFVEGGPPVFITSRNVSITDNDIGATIASIRIDITDPADGLSELIESTTTPSLIPTVVNNVTLTYMIVPDNSSLAYVENFLTSLTYRNARTEPTPGDRVITISVSDGIEDSNTALVNLTVVTVNDNRPRFSQDAYSASVDENRSAGTSVTSVITVDSDSGVEGVVSYELISSDPPVALERFTILPSGEIQTIVSLDREDVDFYTLNVSAFDGGSPPLGDFATVTVMVLDVNDQTPTFPAETDFNLVVSELRGINFTVETVQAVDGDLGSNGAIVYRMGLGAGSPFSVQPDGQIVVAEMLDADIPNPVFNVTVIATDLVLSSEAVFTITVLDENDNAPQFALPEFEGSILENLAPPVAIVTASASDIDSTSNAVITYSFADPTTGINFAVDPTTGEISSRVTFDRESASSYQFTVVATDNGTAPLSSSAVVRIVILDQNDVRPAFNQTMYNGQVAENAPADTSILQVFAADGDEGNNSDLRYSIVASTAVMPLNSLDLSIDPETGVISVSEPADFEVQQAVTFTVEAVDLGNPALTGSTTVTIVITDENDNVPVFMPSNLYEAFVPENEVGYSVIFVTAVDMDANENGIVTYSLQNELDTFEINQTTGEIATLVGLDFERVCFYRLMVVAQDSGSPALNSTALVEVLVIPIHDIEPVFSASSNMTSILENLPSGTSVFQLSATDDDLFSCPQATQTPPLASGSGDMSITTDLPVVIAPTPLEYSLLNLQDVFTVDNATGLITTLTELDREDIDVHSLTVRATDEGGLFAEVVITVRVLDVNDNIPEFLQLTYSASTSENVAEGTTVLQVVARDADMLDQGRLVYSLDGNPAFVDINPQSGDIFVSGPINFEEIESEFSFRANVQDTAQQIGVAAVTIRILDVNDLPPVIQTLPETQVFTEGQVSLRPFPEIAITDPDSFNTLCSASLELMSPQTVNEPSVSECSCANATDESSCAPGCLEFLQLPDGAFPGVVTPSNNGFSLSLEGNFSIETYEAAILSVEYVNIIFNPVPENRIVSLFVFDCQLPSNVLLQPIEVQLLNVFPPVLDLNGDELGIDYQTVFVERGDPVQVVSDNVTITDQDMIREVQELTGINAWIRNPQDGDLESLGVLAGSVLPSSITLTQHTPHNISLAGVAPLAAYEAALLLLHYSNLASEPNPTPRTIAFVAQEYFLSSDVATTTVTFITSNDHAPIILTNPPSENSMVTYVEETSGVRITAPDAVIEDADSTNDPLIELQVYVVSPSENDFLYIPDGVNISSLISFERQADAVLIFEGTESRSEYEFILRNVLYQFTGDEFDFVFPPRFIAILASDPAFTAFSAVQVALSPVNDQMPVFVSETYSASVPENATVGYSVVQVEAVDGDIFSENRIQYSIVAGDDGNFFVISPENGTIYLNRALDFETTMTHQLIVQAIDLNYVGPQVEPDTTLVSISIDDINDHLPVFNQSLYNVSVAEGVPIGTPVVQVFATDQDGSEMHSELQFMLSGSNDFVIDEQLGVIRTDANIDREGTAFYQLAVTVRNPGSASFDGAVVEIRVDDLDDNPPILTLDPTSAVLREPEPTVLLATALLITDVDPRPPSLNYAIVEILGGSNDTTPTPGYLLSQTDSDQVQVSGNSTKKLVFTSLSRPLDVYIEVLRSVVYHDLADEPENITRVIAYQVGSDSPDVFDLDYTPGPTVSSVQEFSVTVELINDNAPQILLDTQDPSLVNLTLPGCTDAGSYSTVFTEGSPPVPLSHGSLTITDRDSGVTRIHSAVVQIQDPLDSGMEVLTASVSAALEVTLDDDSTDERLVFTGPASAEEFAAVLRTVR